MVKHKKIMIIAGEASGDLHASNLVQETRKILPGVRFMGVGGSRMREVGVDVIFENEEIAVTGFSEVLSKALKIIKAYHHVKDTFQSFSADRLILLDFPDFNLRVARAARNRGIPVLYYISPQVWAWRKGRIRQIQSLVEKIMVILPFEASLYGEKGIFVGHPLLDVVRPCLSPQEVLEKYSLKSGAPLVALLPGSRKNEVQQLLPVLMDAAHLIQEKIPDIQYILPLAPTISEEVVRPMLQNAKVPVHLIKDRTYDVLSLANFAIVASGTATLETAILGIPMLIVYKISRLSYFLAKRLIRVPHIGLINMVAGEEIVPELIQEKVTPGRVMEEALGFLQNRDRSEQVSEKLKAAVTKLGDPGASARAARVVQQCVEERA
jgi:lipid-A-disaccharide synthase